MNVRDKMNRPATRRRWILQIIKNGNIHFSWIFMLENTKCVFRVCYRFAQTSHWWFQLKHLTPDTFSHIFIILICDKFFVALALALALALYLFLSLTGALSVLLSGRRSSLVRLAVWHVHVHECLCIYSAVHMQFYYYGFRITIERKCVLNNVWFVTVCRLLPVHPQSFAIVDT